MTEELIGTGGNVGRLQGNSGRVDYGSILARAPTTMRVPSETRVVERRFSRFYQGSD